VPDASLYVQHVAIRVKVLGAQGEGLSDT
jgi:hypothetical protein